MPFKVIYSAYFPTNEPLKGAVLWEKFELNGEEYEITETTDYLSKGNGVNHLGYSFNATYLKDEFSSSRQSVLISEEEYNYGRAMLAIGIYQTRDELFARRRSKLDE